MRGWLRKTENRAKVKSAMRKVAKGTKKAVKGTYKGTKTAARTIQKERAEWNRISRMHKRKRKTRRKRRKPSSIFNMNF